MRNSQPPCSGMRRRAPSSCSVSLAPSHLSSGETLVIGSASHDHAGWPHRQASAMAPDPDPGIDGGEFLGWRQVETLGVADVVMSILEARKEMPWASAAAVSRQHHDNAIYVQVSPVSYTHLRAHETRHDL